MTQAIQKKLNDSAWARWTALILVALTMFFGYMFVDVLSPLQNMLESTRDWSPTIFGLYGGSEFILNVCGFLLVAGIILDKMGVRFTGILSASLMVLGAGIKFYGLSNYFYEGGFGYEFLNSFLTDIPASAKLACLGFMIFGCGTEIAVGQVADLTVFDLNETYTVDPETFLTMGRATPFTGTQLTGACKLTMIGGEIVWKEDTL